MAEAVKFVTQPRKTHGKRAARKMRKEGLVPGVVYGHKEETVAVSLPSHELEKAIRHGVRVLILETGGKNEQVLIKEVQWDHLGMDLLHIDFKRVSEDERIILMVPIEIRGVAPGVTAGGVLDQPLHTLSIECPAISVPDSIRVNVGELQIGSVIHVRELVLPPGVKAMADPDIVVVHVTQKQLEPEAAPAVPIAAEQAEPEVIGRQQKEVEEEAES